ncbi:hypothetical protein [Sorangium cellulosum]|uniref:Immunity protein 30 domain-containing protein n=1 Tax=Sorangium cellulosum So0157-2 TaxID=1254432 RepID=S4XMG9_SORCE|nr:hypothetical protein [Sorangium cellulosum]AGP33611.1 hypothetical protein SCE1572_03320 [Sorangium cellulosum So0157-2]
MLTQTDSIVELVRSALSRPSDRALAVDVFRCLSEEDQKKLFPDLLALSCYAHGLSGEAIQLLMLLPRDWVTQNIEAHAENILRDATYEEYRMLIQVYAQLSPALARKLAERAVQSNDDDIKEAGEDYLAQGAGGVVGTS